MEMLRHRSRSASAIRRSQLSFLDEAGRRRGGNGGGGGDMAAARRRRWRRSDRKCPARVREREGQRGCGRYRRTAVGRVAAVGRAWGQCNGCGIAEECGDGEGSVGWCIGMQLHSCRRNSNSAFCGTSEDRPRCTYLFSRGEDWLRLASSDHVSHFGKSASVMYWG